MSNIAKISVEKHNSSDLFLYDLDKNLAFSDIVVDICKKSGLPRSPVYGLKLLKTKENPYVNTYLTEESYKTVQHLDCLKIAFSLEYLLNNDILPHLNGTSESPERAICYEDLRKLALDPEFINELAKNGNHQKVIDTFMNNDTLNDYELVSILMTMCHLFQKNFIVNTSKDILTKMINVLTSERARSNQIKYILSMFHKILVHKDEVFTPWKQQIVKAIPIKDLMKLIYDGYHEDLHYAVLLLINTIIRISKANQKTQYIKEMNLKQNRDSIYKHIIIRNNLDRNTEHELYVLQTYILSLYKEALDSEININDNNIVTRSEFELCDEVVKRSTLLMDFEENESAPPSEAISIENLLLSQNERASTVSLISNQSEISKSSSRQTSLSIDCDNLNINYLTLEALKHYKRYHYKIFYQSQIEERVYEPGIFVTSERVVKMLAKILHIGKDPPDSRSVFYQPIVFICSTRMPFFLELFSRTMWLLSRTRREMKVSTIEDYPKVMNVLQKQIKMVLENRPKDFKSLTDFMTETTFDVVLMKWEEEKHEQMKEMLKSHPCILQLKSLYTEENRKYLREKRLNTLKRGEVFPSIKDMKIAGSMFVQLHKNEREISIYEYDIKAKKKKGLIRGIPVKDITHLATEKNCRHKHLVKDLSLIFSVIYGSTLEQVNFIAEKEKIAAYWVDGLSILTDMLNKFTSKYYTEELETLVEMDIRLKILELQNINLPLNAPPIPPLPEDIKPSLPPKPKNLPKNSRKQCKI